MNTKFATYIDHTLLKADAKKEEIMELCQEARQYTFASVCVNPTWVKTAASALEGSPVKVCTVIGFPLGASTSEVKAFETKMRFKTAQVKSIWSLISAHFAVVTMNL